MEVIQEIKSGRGKNMRNKKMRPPSGQGGGPVEQEGEKK